MTAIQLHAQESIELSDARLIATFEDARRLAIDPFGHIYVIDRGAQRLVRLSSDELERMEIGGPGSELADPSGVDPTNGLLILVADRSSGRIGRYSRSLASLGFVGSSNLISPRSIDDDERGERTRGQRMEPGDLVAGPEGEVFFIDFARRDIAKLDPLYRLDRRIGSFGSGRGSLADPVALCLGSDGARLIVADARLQSILEFDLNGAFLRAIPTREGAQATSVRSIRELLMLIRRNGIEVWVDGGWTLHPVPLLNGEWLVDAVPADNLLYILTNRRLLAMELPPGLR